MGLTAYAATDSVTYVQGSDEKTQNECHLVEANSSSWSSGWYAVKENVTISDRVEVSGVVNLILCDGATLTASKGIRLSKDNSLTIYGQSGGSGKLVANALAGSKVVIGKNISSIGKQAFYGCKKLKSIVIKTEKLTAKKVGGSAFKKISSKVKVSVPKKKKTEYKKLLKKKGLPKSAKIK